MTEEDCGTTKWHLDETANRGGDIVEPLNERVLGRTLLHDLVNPKQIL